MPSLTAKSTDGMPVFCTAISMSALRAVAAAWRSCMPATWTDRLPHVGPWSGVSAVSPSTSFTRSSATSSSSATICGSATRRPVPRSTLPVYIVTVPSRWMARKLSTWSRATGLAWARTSRGARLKATTRAPVPSRNSRRVVSSVAISGLLSHQRRGALDGGDDALVRAAAAEVVLQRLPDLALRRAGLPRREERRGLHDHAVDAVAALRRLLLDERLLHQRGLLRRPQPLQRDHLPRAQLRDRQHARAYGLAVDQHGAGAALRQAAPELRAVQSEVVAQDVEERRVGFDIDLVGLAVDVQCGHMPSLWRRRCASWDGCGTGCGEPRPGPGPSQELAPTRRSAGSSSSLIRRMLPSARPIGMPLQCVRRTRKFAPTSSQHGRSCS